MARLKNPRHETFIRHLLEGKDITTAFELAGFNRDSGNANRLFRNPKVKERLAELQNEIAAKTPLTIEKLIGELEEARTQALTKSQFANVIKAVLGKAQLAGLLIDRSKVEVTNTDPFAGLEDKHDIALKMVDGTYEFTFAAYHDYREEDRQYLAQLFLRLMEEYHAAADAYIAEIKARPSRTVNLKALPSPHNGKSDSQPTTD